MGIETMCRCCLSTDHELKSIETEINQSASASSILRECLNVQVDMEDEYPSNVCIPCINQLKNIHQFKLTVLDSYKAFKWQQNIKVESAEHKTSCNNNVKLENYEATHNLTDNGDWSADGGEIQNDAFLKECIQQQKKYSTSKDRPLTHFYCTSCPSKFSEAGELYKHCCDAHPPLNKEGDSCEYCNELFPYPDILQKHKLKHVTGGDCPQLRKRSKGKKKGKPWKRTLMQCEFCGKSLFDNNYYEHIKIHQEKQYACKICGKMFSQSRGFKTHMDSHSSVPKYKCPHCDKVYKFRKSLSDHVKVVHNKERSKLCPTCGKAFFSSDGLKKHLLSHTGIKAHSCHLCDKAYQKKSALKVHLKSHNIYSQNTSEKLSIKLNENCDF